MSRYALERWREGRSPAQLMVHRHHVHLVECSGACRAFAHAVTNPVIHALIAEEVAAGLECRVLEVVAANGAQRKGLLTGVSVVQRRY